MEYPRLPRLIEEMEVARADGRLPAKQAQLGKARLLTLHDWAVSPITERSRHDLLELIDDRVSVGSVLITS